MDDTLSLLFMGFIQVLTPMRLLMCMLSCVMGTLVGVLPGFGPVAALAVLLPTVYGQDPLTALIMLAGLLCGAMYGGTITSVSINVPGETASVVTTFDGYQMAKQGRGGVAMGIAAIGSFIGATVGLLLLTFIGAPLAETALVFGPSEYFAVYLFTFIAIVTIGGGGGGLLRSAISLFLGLLCGTVGIDVITGGGRLTFGSVQLTAGIGFLPAVVGMFGLSEIILTIADNEFVSVDKDDPTSKIKIREVFPKLREFFICLPSIIRGTVVGFFVGLLPGAGASIATFMSYGIEKRLSKNPESFGKGNIIGVAGPETANNSAALGSYVPLLSLGIPGSATGAVLLGAFMLVGIQPGPRLFTENPEVAWGVIASLYIGNVMLLLMNTMMIPFFVWLLRISQKSLPAIVATLCLVGTYTYQNSVFDIFIMLVFACVGICFKKLSIPAAPAVIALVLGQKLELSLRQTLSLFHGNFLTAAMRPITAAILAVCLLLLGLAIRSSVKLYLKNRSLSGRG